MSSVLSNTDFGNLKTWDELKRFVTTWAGEITGAVNGGLEFGPNIRCKIITANFSAANTENTFIHNLGRIPTGYIVVKQSAATSVYDGGTPNTSTAIFLKASAVANTTLLVF